MAASSVILYCARCCKMKASGALVLIALPDLLCLAFWHFVLTPSCFVWRRWNTPGFVDANVFSNAHVCIRSAYCVRKIARLDIVAGGYRPWMHGFVIGSAFCSSHLAVRGVWLFGLVWTVYIEPRVSSCCKPLPVFVWCWSISGVKRWASFISPALTSVAVITSHCSSTARWILYRNLERPGPIRTTEERINSTPDFFCRICLVFSS